MSLNLTQVVINYNILLCQNHPRGQLTFAIAAIRKMFEKNEMEKKINWTDNKQMSKLYQNFKYKLISKLNGSHVHR